MSARAFIQLLNPKFMVHFSKIHTMYLSPEKLLLCKEIHVSGHSLNVCRKEVSLLYHFTGKWLLAGVSREMN